MRKLTTDFGKKDKKRQNECPSNFSPLNSNYQEVELRRSNEAQLVDKMRSYFTTMYIVYFIIIFLRLEQFSLFLA